MEVSAKDCSQAGKRKHFQDKGCQIFEPVAEKSSVEPELPCSKPYWTQPQGTHHK